MLQSGYYGAGVVWGAETQRDPAWMSRNLAELLRWWKQGKLKPPIAKTFPLAEAGAALSGVVSRHYAGRWCCQWSAEKQSAFRRQADSGG